MKTIYKYPLLIGINHLQLPYIKVLDVIIQDSLPVLYALVDTENQNKKLKVIILGTRWELEDNITDGEFLRTITDGKYVWHVFYKEK